MNGDKETPLEKEIIPANIVTINTAIAFSDPKLVLHTDESYTLNVSKILNQVCN